MLRAFFPFYGSKWRLARLYPAPLHSTIIEPFAGSAGYSLHYPQKQILLSDLDPVIVSVWRYLIAASEKEILHLPDIAHNRRVQDYKLTTEQEFLIGFWMNKGMTAPCKKPSAWLRSNIRPNSNWGPTVRFRIASQLQYIRHWQISERCYTSLNNTEATYFVDPPYVQAGRRYTKSSRDINFYDLAQWCQTRRWQIIVCEANTARWLPFAPLCSAKTARAKHCAEAVYISNPSSLSQKNAVPNP